jgi:hypothetical protein
LLLRWRCVDIIVGHAISLPSIQACQPRESGVVPLAFSEHSLSCSAPTKFPGASRPGDLARRPSRGVPLLRYRPHRTTAACPAGISCRRLIACESKSCRTCGEKNGSSFLESRRRGFCVVVLTYYVTYGLLEQGLWYHDE